jgi:hypothetical protein
VGAAEPLADGLASPAFTHSQVGEGVVEYQVVALDCAGNASPPASLRVRVDLTAPEVSIDLPRPDAAVSGEVEVKGTAFSPSDFKEYRLFVGAGEQPSSFTLLKRSALPVSRGPRSDRGGTSSRSRRRTSRATSPEPPSR